MEKEFVNISTWPNCNDGDLPITPPSTPTPTPTTPFTPLLAQAIKWLNRAISLNPDYGDAWAWLYKYTAEKGSPKQVAKVVERCKAADPKHGEVWVTVSKDVSKWTWSTEQVLHEAAIRLVDAGDDE